MSSDNVGVTDQGLCKSALSPKDVISLSMVENPFNRGQWALMLRLLHCLPPGSLTKGRLPTW